MGISFMKVMQNYTQNNGTKHNKTYGHYSDSCCAEYHSAQCCCAVLIVMTIIMLNVITLSVVVVNVWVP
jgi:hypothetical protein